MLNTKLNTDFKYQKMRNNQNNKSFLRQLDPVSTVSNKCMNRTMHVQSNTPGNLIDIDSMLRGYNHKQSKGCDLTDADISPYINQIKTPVTCNKDISSEHTKVLYPTKGNKTKSIAGMGMQFPIDDPQQNIFTPFAIGSRNYVKDKHVTKWPVSFDQSHFKPDY